MNSLSQLPPEFKKNPAAHFEHAFPSSPVVHPALHVHCPFSHFPLTQLHVSGLFSIVGARQRPVPVMPSSQDVQPTGHAWQATPKKPFAQSWHESPVKPGGQVQVPEAEHTPAPAQGGEHEEDWMSTSAREPDEPLGS